MQSDQQQDLQRKSGVEELEVQLSKINEHKRKGYVASRLPF